MGEVKRYSYEEWECTTEPLPEQRTYFDKKGIPITGYLEGYYFFPDTLIDDEKNLKFVKNGKIKTGEEMNNRKHTMDKHMMATKAYHKLGDISRDHDDLCRVYDQDDENFYGMWVTGYGFFDVKFPKETTRELTKEEIKQFSEMNISLSGCNLGKIKLKV